MISLAKSAQIWACGILFCFFLPLKSSAQNSVLHQDSLKVMFYNLWNFDGDPDSCGWKTSCLPDTTFYPHRLDTLRDIISYDPPDVFLVCELRNDQASGLIMSDVLAPLQNANYDSARFLLNSSGGSSLLNNMFYYNPDKIVLYGQWVVPTSIRDLNIYRTYLSSPTDQLGSDIVFIDFIVGHLKAGNTAPARAERKDAIESLNLFMLGHNMAPNLVFGADFNIYKDQEPAYQSLLNSTNFPFHDPIDSGGVWNDSLFQGILTQSTRKEAYCGIPAGGGLDDRFDQLLVSGEIMSGSKGVTFIPGTYTAWGNEGTQYDTCLVVDNQAGKYPASLKSKLYHMSDHLPVVMQLKVEYEIVLPLAAPIQPEYSGFRFANPVRDRLNIWNEGETALKGQLSLTSVQGKRLLQRPLALRAGEKVSLGLEKIPPGFYLLTVISPSGESVLRKKLIHY